MPDIKTYILDQNDHALIKAAQAEIEKPLRHDWHRVACALQLSNGDIYTGIVMEAENPSLTVCAEPITIGKVLDRLSKHKIETIVAIRSAETTDHKVIPPCGRCREFITDYANDAFVIVADNQKQAVKVKAADLLPFKYERVM